MNRAKSCTLNYSSLYERGNAKEQYTLVKEKDDWKIFDYRIAPYPTEAERGKVQI